MWKLILIFSAALIVGAILVLIVASTRPDSFRIQREILIQAPPERIQPLISDLRRWADWSPYDKLDPEMKKTFSDPSAGIGACYEWDGNSQAGAGRMEISRLEPGLVEIQLKFERPMNCRNIAEFTLVPAGEGTQVTWSMSGEQPLLSKVAGLFLDLDRLIGKDFESGLTELKRISEGAWESADDPSEIPARSPGSGTGNSEPDESAIP